ncbi:hypothetical protein S40285_07178 [Stachybotrys chlorohalonatus IBT 40285]|uniref:Uncharacterized protein n=1 Tax=Stachybotrys chlorohalonatus (strain IBT 40285) TaxID=1283841 RepID=A0A084QPW3_STAC4|nr:hypothetical protein S40285_07178 [Stachybotrys chlorohalonata IBT 40285]
MPEVATDPSFPKPARRFKAGDSPYRQVQFSSYGEPDHPKSRDCSCSACRDAPLGNNNTKEKNNIEFASVLITETSKKPASSLSPVAPASARGTSGSQQQWHTSVDPTKSLPLPGLQAALPFGCFGPQPVASNNAFVPHSVFSSAPNVTYVGTQQPVLVSATQPKMPGEYQNTAPPPNGLNFQPPVPDTTFGPMQHLYVPRFDGGVVPGLQVGAPQFTYQPVVGGVAVSNQPPGYVVAQQPAYAQHSSFAQNLAYVQHPAYNQQPMVGQQAVMWNGQAYVPAAPQQFQQFQHIQGVQPVGMGPNYAVGSGFPVIAGNSGPAPDILGIGHTQGEETVRQLEFAYANKLFEPQEFKPADEDPSRFYYVREVDGSWTQRNRFSIDSNGDCRWYVTDEGWFYAVRLPD